MGQAGKKRKQEESRPKQIWIMQLLTMAGISGEEDIMHVGGDFHSPAFDVAALQAVKNKHGARLSLKGICMSIQKEQIKEKIDKY